MREPSTASTKWVAVARSASCECLISWVWGREVAMSCMIVPPKAAANTCIPRQMPNMGICRLYAKRVKVNSNKSRSVLMPCKAGTGSSPTKIGLMSAPPERSRPSIRSSNSDMLALGIRLGAIITGMPPAASTERK